MGLSLRKKLSIPEVGPGKNPQMKQHAVPPSLSLSGARPKRYLATKRPMFDNTATYYENCY